MDKSEAIAYCIMGVLLACGGIAAMVWVGIIGRYSAEGTGWVVFGGLVCLILGLLRLGAGLG